MLDYIFPAGMIFVFVAYENIQAHTAAFLGLQFALYWMTLQNCILILHQRIGFTMQQTGGGYLEAARRTQFVHI